MIPETRARRVPPDVRVEVVNALISAATVVVETMAGIAVERQPLRVEQSARARGDVTGVIGFMSENVDGMLAVSFTEECVLAVVSSMLGESYTELGDQVTDAVGELTNIISGNARAELSQRDLQFDMAIPMVVTRRGHQLSFPSEETVIVLPFRTAHGDFFLQVCLKPAAITG